MNAKYKVTGITREGKRFRVFTDSAIHAQGINLYRGTVWKRIESYVEPVRWKVVYRVFN